MKKIKLSFFSVLFLIFSLIFIDGAFALDFGASSYESVSGSARIANRRTALRFLQLAKQHASEKNWNQVISYAENGLHFDDTISDLWYLKAVAISSSGGKKSEVLSLVTRALNDGEWVDYNRDGARILYADILSIIGKSDLVFSVLDSQPMLYSSDAEFIRSKAYYKNGDEESLEKARRKIDTARRIYPNDTRFPLLFFRFECMLAEKKGYVPDSVRKIADSFIDFLPHYKNPDVELEIYSCIFAEGEKRTRMLKSFNARGLRHILYAREALKEGLMSQESALDYFLTFAGNDKMLNFSDLVNFVPYITEENSRKYFSEVLNAYNGTILFDKTEDFNSDFSVKYNRGRPSFVSCYLDQDDNVLWSAECDFGVPSSIKVTSGSLELFYNKWPYVEKVVYFGGKNGIDLTFNLVSESFAWTPFNEKIVPEIKDALNLDFYVPEILEEREVEPQKLLRSAYNYMLPSQERKNALITVSLLDGVPQTAVYSVDGSAYARTIFGDGIPLSRSVDCDGDGLFETTETYGFNPSLNQNILSHDDEMQIMTNLFGAPSSGSGFYVKSIQVDLNGDTVPDFMEEYLKNEGKISSWDYNADGQWDVQYVLLGKDGSGIKKEISKFQNTILNETVTVYSENEKPQFIEMGGVRENVLLDEEGVYWIRKKGTLEDSKKILNAVAMKNTMGDQSLLDSDGYKIFIVKIGKLVCASIIEDSENAVYGENALQGENPEESNKE